MRKKLNILPTFVNKEATRKMKKTYLLAVMKGVEKTNEDYEMKMITSLTVRNISNLIFAWASFLYVPLQETSIVINSEEDEKRRSDHCF